jgi:5-dehydro-4-deoxyglucarate dehydratase
MEISMSNLSPQETAKTLAKGLLSFPVTHFGADLTFQEGPYRAHCDWLLSFKRLTGLFCAGGTGEIFSLTPNEVFDVTKAAVAATKGRIPVIAGAAYGTATAIEMAKNAEKAGADGILLLPPYLITPNQEGLVAHIDAVCKSTSIAVILYSRANGIASDESMARLCERNANLVGYKDGVGSIELMMRVYARMGDRLTYIGGLPTAETFALPYLEMGVTTYSSAIFNFMPEWALAFYDAVRAKDQTRVIGGIRSFVMPYLAIRDEDKGYAVSIVKAGLKAIGRPAGPVRPPLTDLTDGQLARLKKLIEATKPV